MKLPNAEQAVVEQSKVVFYLLNPTHRFGGSKAKFFASFGFNANTWSVLAEALRQHALIHEVGSTRETGFGLRYEVDGTLETPNGAQPCVRTVWQFDRGAHTPRLITAYPLEES